MPTKHLRVCPAPCGKVRFSACSKACRLPNDIDPESWRINLQDGARHDRWQAGMKRPRGPHHATRSTPPHRHLATVGPT
ncbi:hypothetical protein PBI_TWEETY_97 [Mycobacterium phage Tweety]|uniref:Uncharacterized protein n=1 Tax=Mycobacterium phage Tweety TaxID=439809 RepID=A5YK65_9CAUD|nr:hypothetical protein PBI_TWEETY_97 [Mycobacterium phage Tweety]ABQ86166.1 hypothetical protein PBI_TWEETY_97 [Mycobacterium phage Tweety]